MEIDNLKPCPFCGQQQNERQMLVLDPCDSDGWYVKCDSCGACGPVGYPGDNYVSCNIAERSAKEKAISLWAEIGDRENLARADLAACRERNAKLEKVREAAETVSSNYTLPVPSNFLDLLVELDKALTEAGEV